LLHTNVAMQDTEARLGALEQQLTSTAKDKNADTKAEKPGQATDGDASNSKLQVGPKACM
jgi:hypothetical protein